MKGPQCRTRGTLGRCSGYRGGTHAVNHGKMTIVARYVDTHWRWAWRTLHEASLQEALPLELGRTRTGNRAVIVQRHRRGRCSHTGLVATLTSWSTCGVGTHRDPSAAAHTRHPGHRYTVFGVSGRTGRADGHGERWTPRGAFMRVDGGRGGRITMRPYRNPRLPFAA